MTDENTLSRHIADQLYLKMV